MKPPRIARWILSRSLPDDYRAPVIGDLDEEFTRQATHARSAAMARLWYWTQVLTSLPGAWRLRQRRWRFDMLSDWRFAWRRLGRSPLFTLFAVVTLGVGIGATTTVYSAVRAAVGPPSGVRNLSRIVNVFHAPGGAPAFGGLSGPDYQDWRTRQSVFDAVTAWSFMGVAYAAGGQTGTSFGELVGGEYFSVLGVTPLRGRLLQPADDRPDAPPVVVISQRTWQRIFAEAEDVVGRTMKVNGHTFEIVGVVSPEFRGLFNNGLTPSALWVPVASAAQVYHRSPGVVFDPSDRDKRFLLAKGILKTGKTVADVRTELSVIGGQLDSAYPLDDKRQWQATPMADLRINDSASMGVMVDGLVAVLMLAVGAVLLVACTNLANLALARDSGRRQDVAVRLALGASRWRLVRSALTESLLIAVAGGLLGLGVARVLLVIVSGELAVSGTIATMQIAPRLDVPVLLVAAAATALALVVAGLGPALQATRGDVRTALVGDGAAGTAPRWRGKRYLIAGQVAVSVILLALAALGLAQLRSIQNQDYGFALHELAIAEVDFEGQRFDDARIARVVEGFLAQMSARPDIRAVSVATGLPAGPRSYRQGQITGTDTKKPISAEIIVGGPRLIETFGVPIRHGRAWDATDPPGAAVAVVDEWTARALFGTTNVVGRDFDLRMRDQSARALTVIGVVGDTNRAQFMARGQAVIYMPFHHDYGERIVFAARTSGDPAALADGIRQSLRGLDQDLALKSVGAGPDVIGSAAQFFQISAAIATLLGAFAWALALAGLYGVLTQLVVRRTREIGVRVALGASRTEIIRMVVREGLSPVVLGVVAGLGLGALARFALRPQFLRLVPAMDLVVLVLVPLLFVAAAVLACYLPARRAASVNPIDALRHH